MPADSTSSSLPPPPLKAPQSPGNKSGSGSGPNSQNGSFGKDQLPRSDSPPSTPPLATHQIVGSYTADETAFHRAFPAVPLSEKLVDHYQCSVMRNKVVRLGKLYLTSTRLCFTSTFIRDPINLPWEAVASVQRRTNFLFDSIVLKRTKEAIDAQHHSRHHHQHSRSMSQGFDATATSIDSLTSPKETPGSTTATTTTNNTSFQQNTPAVDHLINEQIYGSGGVGDEESLTGFISGSSDQAFRMIQMLWSVRSRFQQQERDAATALRNNNQNGEDDDDSKSHGIDVESPHLGSGSEAGNMSTTSPLLGSGGTPTTATATTTTTQNDEDGTSAALSPLAPSTHQLATKALKLEPVATADADAAGGDTTTTTAAGSPTSTTTDTNDSATKKRSKSMGRYISSGLRSSMSAVSSVIPGTGSSTSDRKKGATAAIAPAVAASPDDEKPPYVLHPSDDEGGTPEEDLDGTSVQTDDGQDDDDGPVSPSQIPQPMSALQQAAGVAAGDVNAHKYTALLLKSFPLVPKNEVVIESFQCSYVSGVHRLGRLYVTSNYLLFSSPFMSEGLVIRMVDVASISRWQTMKVLDGLSIDIRPDTKTLTAAQLMQAGGILPAVAINNSRVLNPQQQQQLPPSSASAAALAAAADTPLNDDDVRASTASPHGSPTTPRFNKSRSTSVINRQETMEANGNNNTAGSDGESYTPPRSPSPHTSGGSRPQSQSVSMTTPPLGSSFAAVSSATSDGAFYTKTSYAFTSFVGSRDAALKLVRHLHAPHYIRAEEAADTAKEAVSTAATTQQQQQAASEQAAASAAVDGSSPSPSSPTIPSSSAAPPPPPAALRPANEAAFYLTAPKLEDSYAALNTVYGTDISPITNFFNGDNSRKLLAEQPVYFPEGVGLMDVFRDVWSDDTRAIDGYHSDRKDTEMKWTKWDRITSCDGHTSVTKQLEDVPADSLDADSVAGKEFLPPAKAGQRVLKCKTLVKAVGCTVCDFTEYQKYAFMKVPASDLYGTGSTLGGFPPPASAQKDGNRRLLVVQISGQAVGAMFSDTFRAEALLIFEEEVVGGGSPSAYHPLSTKIVPGDAGASTAAPPKVRVSMVCYGHIQFVKSVWGIKGKIVSVALTVEMPECYRTFFHEQMKPRALKLIKSRQQHSSLTNTAASIAGAAAAGIVEAVASVAGVMDDGSGEVNNSADCGSPSHSSGSPTRQQSGVIITQHGGGGGGVSLRGSLSPANLFPSAGFGENNTPPQMAILAFVTAVAFFVVWWSAWGLMSCLFGSVSVPTISSSTPLADGIIASSSSSSSPSDVATAEVHAAIFNIYIRPLIGSVYGLSLAVSVSVMMEYIQQLTK